MSKEQPNNEGQERNGSLYKPSTLARTMKESDDRIGMVSGSILERADTIIYTSVGLCFLVGAIIALIYGIWEFGSQIHDALNSGTTANIASSVIQFVSDMLLVLIIMEVLSTVIHYLKAHATSLRPFLFIGIISATRSILSIGARLSLGGVEGNAFRDAMIELGVSAAVVLALGVTLKLLGQMAETGAAEP